MLLAATLGVMAGAALYLIVKQVKPQKWSLETGLQNG